MKIDQKELITLTGAWRSRAGIIDPILFEKKVHKWYCEPMTVTRVCPGNCRLFCSQKFIRVLRVIQPEKERDVYGALVIGLRRARDNAIRLEEERPAGKVPFPPS